MGTSVNEFNKRGSEESFYLNRQAQTYYEQRLFLIASSMFKWSGLPSSIPPEFIENNLYTNGALAFADDSKFGLVCCKFTASNPNMYDEYQDYNLQATTGYNEMFKRGDIVLLKNNSLATPTVALADYYLKKLFEIDRTIDTNVVQQKNSKIILCDEAQKLTVQNMLMKHEGNVAFVLGSKQLSDIQTSTLDLTTPFISPELYELKMKIWGECLDMLGINNANTQKKERLITDEVNANNGLLQLSNDIFYETRLRACRELNKKFGLSVKVERREIDGSLYGDIGGTDTE